MVHLKKKGHLIFFSKASKQSAHTEDVTEETIYIWQCAGSSCSGTGYYDSIAERLSEPAQTALSRAVSHWGRDNNALMKYDTLPLHRTPTTSLSRTLHLTPTVGVGELQCCPVRWYTGWIHVCVCMHWISTPVGYQHNDKFMINCLPHVDWIRKNNGLHAWRWLTISKIPAASAESTTSPGLCISCLIPLNVTFYGKLFK